MSTRHTTDWFVPVRCAGDIATVQTGRLPDGLHVGIAFSSLDRLRAASGAQDFMRVSEDSLHDMLGQVGIARIQLDPTLVAVPVRGAVAS
ncbi:SAV_915 family protein [Kribbella sp. NPDC000426]|uniref:SAV_915 family protein n=1 Tax=Kribbella sp. NPDC000426 TaxID=3154255 RepID=UPI003327A070